MATFFGDRQRMSLAYNALRGAQQLKRERVATASTVAQPRRAGLCGVAVEVVVYEILGSERAVNPLDHLELSLCPVQHERCSRVVLVVLAAAAVATHCCGLVSRVAGVFVAAAVTVDS